MVKLFKSIAENPRVKQLGPGLITGAADDDPSGIATYSQAGAQFGFNMLWTVVFTYPLMVGIQMVSARLGFVTGKGLAANVKSVFPRPVLFGIVGLLLVANTINIAADIAAMGEALRLLLGGYAHLYSVCFGVLCLILQVYLRYETYVRYLKWLTLALLSYVAVIFTIHVHWATVVHEMVLPHLSMNHDTITMIVAVFGTTISPYLFFWQASQEAEDTKTEPARRSLRRRPSQGPDALARIRFDTLVGMAVSNLVALAILGTAAATLHLHGTQEITSAAQAAEALKPIAGNFAFALFALGIIGTGLLSVPVLAGSAAYALGEARGWAVGLSRQPGQAKAFYAVIAGATLIGALANVFKFNPMKALVWSAALNAVVAVPIMVLIMMVSADNSLMGKFRISGAIRATGWAATSVMAIASAAFLLSLGE